MKMMSKAFRRLLLILAVVGSLAAVAWAAGSSAPEPILSLRHVNPIYADLELKFPQLPASARTHAEVTANSMEEAAECLRNQMEQRVYEITIIVNGYDFENYQQMYDDWYVLLHAAFEHTGVPSQGDYLDRHYHGCGGAYNHIEGNMVSFTFRVNYMSNNEQEKAVENRIDELFDRWEQSFAFSDLSDYDKVRCIYDYICANVTYDYDNLNDSEYLLKYSAYAALIDGTAVCNGYAALFYRMLLEADVDNRAITGMAGGYHAWNIVQLGDCYYFADSTWDAGASEYRYFLLSEENSADHIPDDEYLTTDFKEAYPMGTENYVGDYSLIVQYPVVGGNLTFNLLTQTIIGSDETVEEAVIPRTIEGVAVTAIAADAFLYRYDLRRVELPEGLISLGRYAFGCCSSLESLDLPASLKTLGLGAFYNCGALTHIDLPEGISELPDTLFAYCWELESVGIPGSVTAIGERIFYNCGSFSDVYFGGTREQWEAISCEADNEVLAAAVIHCIDPDLGVPVLAVKNDINTGEIVLAWDAVDGAAGYEVYRSSAKNGSYAKLCTIAETTLRDTDAAPGDTYYYKVRTLGETDFSLFSASEGKTCDLPRPTLTVTNRASTGKPVLTWNAIEGADAYEIWYSTTKNGVYTKLGTVTDTGAAHNSAVAGKTYYYKVRAICAANSAATSTASLPVGKTCDLARPTVKVAIKASSGKPVLSWDAVPGASKYTIYVASSKNGTYQVLGTVTGTSVTHSSAEAGQTYYYRVKAVHATNSGAAGAASVAVGKTCDLAMPVVTVKLNADGKPVISWTAVPGAVKYELYRSTEKNGSYTRLWSGTLTEVTNNTITPGATYYYRVKAICANSGGNSAASVAVSVTCAI